jgi:hypothetical protein
MDKQIELAKSWFILAQITIILAGLFFASAGIMFTNAQNTLNFGLDLAERATSKDCNLINNVSSYQNFTIGVLDYVGESVYANLDLFMIYIKIGFGLVIVSVVLWITGYIRLKRLKID